MSTGTTPYSAAPFTPSELVLLSECQDKQADLWKLLTPELRAAIKSRTEDTDTDFD